MNIRAASPERTYVHLHTGPGAQIVDVTPDFWETIDQRTELHSGRLVTGFEMLEPWDMWEMHPAGDEFVAVTEGSVDIHFDDGETISDLTVTAPEYVMIPAGTWHTMDVERPARLLLITWGEDTQHRPR